MKAIVQYEYGSPDVLKCEEVQKPTAGDDEVLIRVHAASANPLDWRTLRADPFIIRLMGEGLLKPKNKILGVDVAGQVEAIGKNVREFQPGDCERSRRLGSYLAARRQPQGQITCRRRVPTSEGTPRRREPDRRRCLRRPRDSCPRSSRGRDRIAMLRRS